MTSAEQENREPPALHESLTFAVQAIAARAGYSIGRDDLNAALGLSFCVTAVPREGDLARWPLYARDAFLIQAGRLFGLTIRELHPPEAARGLRGSPEFEQHFDASYRPLISRALENDQPVLAWQGWPDDRDLMWGIITGCCDGGIGLGGVTYGSVEHAEAPDSAPLHRPPVQLYVVESVEPKKPDREELFDLALENARKVLSNGLWDCFDVVTGPEAYDLWIARLGDPREEEGHRETEPQALACATPERPGSRSLAQSHRRLATAVIAGHRSAIRFLVARAASSPNQPHAPLEQLTSACRTVVRTLEQTVQPAALDSLGGSPPIPGKVLDALAFAQNTTKEMLSACIA